MKKLVNCALIILLSTVFVFAQENKSGEKKSKVIIKKIEVENVNGVETTRETLDTLEGDLLNNIELNEINMEGIDLQNIDVSEIDNGSGDKKVKVIVRKKNADDHEKNMMGHEIPEGMQWVTANTQTSPNKAVLGVQLENVDGANGAQVSEVFEGSAAEKIGLVAGDILISVNGKKTKDVESVISILAKNNPGDKVKIKYLRETEVKSATATLQERKAEVMNKSNCASQKKCKVQCIKSCPGSSIEKDEVIILKEGDENKKVKVLRKADGGKDQKVIIIKKDDGDHGEVIKEIEIKQDEKNPEEKVIDIRTDSESSLNVEVLTGSPNPNNGQMKISFTGKNLPTTVEVLDLNGKEVFKERIDNFNGTYNKEIQIEDIKGTMILKVTQGEKVISQKIIVK